ncbi:MAG TPA: SIS domain-containing protein [Acidimicrobiales bacterium]|nr:SIS domain-containing protein [Acidimicrobiales bacterium]
MTPALDSLGLFELAASLPKQASDARIVALGLDIRSIDPAHGAPAIRNVVAVGMGGSGIGGDIVAAIGQPVSPVPIVVIKDHHVPAFVSDESLVIATSFSGRTAETLDALKSARHAGARIVVLSSGGAMAALAREWNVPHVALDASIAMDRAAIAAVSMPPLVLLGRLGLLPGIDADIDAAITQLQRRVAQMRDERNPARELARRLGRTMPLIYGAGPIGGVAAYRWKCQLNENAKEPAFSNVVPELDHNELAGWGQHGDMTRQVLTAVHLRHDFEPPRVARAFEFIGETQQEVVASVHEIRAEGGGRLAQLFDLVAFGDFVSLFVAAQEGLDPGPVPVLDELEQRLG